MNLINAKDARFKAKGKTPNQELEELMSYINDAIEEAAEAGKTELLLAGPNGEFTRLGASRDHAVIGERLKRIVIGELERAGYKARIEVDEFSNDITTALCISWEDA